MLFLGAWIREGHCEGKLSSVESLWHVPTCPSAFCQELKQHEALPGGALNMSKINSFL